MNEPDSSEFDFDVLLNIESDEEADEYIRNHPPKKVYHDAELITFWVNENINKDIRIKEQDSEITVKLLAAFELPDAVKNAVDVQYPDGTVTRMPMHLLFNRIIL